MLTITVKRYNLIRFPTGRQEDQSGSDRYQFRLNPFQLRTNFRRCL